MMMPRRAASEIEPMIATGMAISSGQGVATTSTARKRTGSPLATHATRATATARGVYSVPGRARSPHQPRQEAHRLATGHPRNQGDGDGQGRVQRAELVAQPPQTGPLLLRS